MSWSISILRDFIALISSFFFGTDVLMSRSSSAFGMSASSSGDGLLRISLNCSVQRSSCSQSVVRRDPWLSLMMVFALAKYFPQMSFVI